MPGQHIIKFFIYLAAVSIFYILFKQVIDVLKTQPQCGTISDCTDTLGYLNTFEPYFLFVALLVGVIWLIVKGINASNREVRQ